MEYYVVETYCQRIGRFLYKIKKHIGDDDSVILVSDSYQVCKEFVSGIDSYN
jgi:hypothetical protein